MGDFQVALHVVAAISRTPRRFAPTLRLLRRYDRQVSHTNKLSLLVYYIQTRYSLSSRRSNVNLKPLRRRLSLKQDYVQTSVAPKA